jgi:hypothetical protein
MFDGELLYRGAKELSQNLSSMSSSPRLRAESTLNGKRVFVKSFGDIRRQCFVDMLKPVFRLPQIGCNWMMLPGRGLVLVCEYHPHLGCLGEVGLPPNEACELATILCFDVWIRNNDRTASNVLVLPDGNAGSRLLPIDETAAFKRDATLRMSAFRKQLRSGPWATDPVAWAEDISLQLDVDAMETAFSLSWAGGREWQSRRPELETRLEQLPQLWEHFATTQIGVDDGQ